MKKVTIKNGNTSVFVCSEHACLMGNDKHLLIYLSCKRDAGNLMTLDCVTSANLLRVSVPKGNYLINLDFDNNTSVNIEELCEK